MSVTRRFSGSHEAARHLFSSLLGPWSLAFGGAATVGSGHHRGARRVIPTADDWIDLAIDDPVWDRFFTVAPLTLVGTWEADGAVDLAPKHLGGPAAWTNLFGFVCAPHHATYRNIRREGVYGVSYPRPDQVLFASLAAAPRDADASKPSLAALPTEPGPTLGVPLLQGAGVQLECELVRVVDDLDANALIIGRIAGARVVAAALRDPDRDDADVIAAAPLLAFIAPDHFAAIANANHFPFHAGWRR